MIVGISGYVGNKITGIGRVLVNVLKEWSKISPNDKFILFQNFDFEGYEELENVENIDIIKFSVSKNSPIKNILWHQFGFPKLLKKNKCDVAYIPNFSLLLRKVVPTVVTIHDLIEFNVPDKFSKKRMFYRIHIADPLLAKKSDRILTVSYSSKRDIEKFLKVPEKKITVTPNATDKSVYKVYQKDAVVDVLDKYSLKYKGYLLFVGTIDFPGKNLKTVVDAFFRLKEKKGISEKLVIIGKDGFNAHVIHETVQSSAYSKDVIFTGYVSDADLPYFYAGAKIMTYLSLYEGFGLPVLEAMSCGTAVLCPNTSCFPEIVGELDVCVPPTDIDLVEEKMWTMLSDDELLNSIAQKGYELSQKYDWKESAKIYKQVFDDFLNK